MWMNGAILFICATSNENLVGLRRDLTWRVDIGLLWVPNSLMCLIFVSKGALVTFFFFFWLSTRVTDQWLLLF